MRIDLRLLLRRAVVTVAVVGSLFLGAATIRAASQWTASEAPLAAPPVTVESLSAQLAAERGRSSDIAARLQAVSGQTAELESALGTANTQLGTDTATAKGLQDRIAAAKKKLAALNRQIAATARQAAAARRTVTVRRVVVRKPAAQPAPPPVEHDD